MPGSFLVMIKSGVYLIRFDGADTVCTKVPSAAEHFTYRGADRVVYTLRGRGFDEAMVATLGGLPATAQTILDTRAAAEEFTVKFAGYYFTGRDRLGSPLGSRDPLEAKSMSRETANEVCARLKRMRFEDAEIIDFGAIESSLESELRRVWGSNPEPTPESVTIQDK